MWESQVESAADSVDYNNKSNGKYHIKSLIQ